MSNLLSQSWHQLRCTLQLLPSRSADHTDRQRNRGQGSDQGKGESGCFPLIVVETAGKQQPDSRTKHDARAGNQDDICYRQLWFDHDYSPPTSFLKASLQDAFVLDACTNL